MRSIIVVGIVLLTGCADTEVNSSPALGVYEAVLIEGQPLAGGALTAYSMEFKWSLTSHEGETTNAHGSWTYVLKHLDGRWRAVHSAGTHLFE